MTGTFERFDARLGGSYRMVLRYSDATASLGKTTPDTDVVEVRFVDLVPNVRVIQEVDFVSDTLAVADTMTMTWEVSAVAGGTRLDITATNVPDTVAEEDHVAGLASSLAKLASLLERRAGSVGIAPTSEGLRGGC